MTSASTKRPSVATLQRQWTGVAIGTKVTVHRANGRTLHTITLCEPFGLHAGAYVRVQGIDGNTHLRRVTLGWDTAEPEPADEHLPWNAKAEKEIQRLRAAMVHAMDDCERVSQVDHYADKSTLLATLRKTAASLKTALEKK